MYSELIISWVATNLQDVMQAAGVALVLIGPGSVEQVFVHLHKRTSLLHYVV